MSKQFPPEGAFRSYGKHVIYIANGITLEEGEEIVKKTLGKGTWQIEGRFIEEPVKRNHVRTELQKALDLCREKKCILVLPKMVHLTQSKNFLMDTLEARVPVIGCDLLGPKHIQIDLLAQISAQLRSRVSKGVKEHHARLKEQGIKLGSPNIKKAQIEASKARTEKADQYAEKILPIVAEIEKAGATTLTEIAYRLNERGVPTTRGGRWYPSSVRNLLLRRKK